MHQKIPLLIILIFVLCGHTMVGSSIEADSIKISQADINDKVALSKEFIKEYGLTNALSAINIAEDRLLERNLSALDKIFFTQEQARSYYYKDKDKSSYYEKLELANGLLDTYDGDQDDSYFLLKYNNVIINNLQNITKSVDFYETFASYFEALEFAQRSNDLETIAKANRMIGYLYYQNEEYDNSLFHFKKYLDLAKENSPDTVVVHEYWTNYAIADIYIEKGVMDSASLYINQIDPSTNPIEHKILSAKVESGLRHYTTSNTILESILNKENQIDRQWEALVDLDKGNNYYQLGSLKAAEKHWNLARDGFISTNNIRRSRNVNEILYNYYSENSNSKQALIHLEEYKTLNDSIKKPDFILLQQTREKSKELELSKLKNEFLTEQEIGSQSVIRQQRIFSFTSVVVFGIVFIYLVKLIELFRKRKSSNTELTKLHNDLRYKEEASNIYREKMNFWMQSMRHAILALDEHYNITYSNQYFLNYLSESLEWKGVNFFELLGYNKEEQSTFASTLTRNSEIEFVRLNPNRSGVYNIIIKELIFEDTNMTYGVIMRDLTEIKEQELQKTRLIQTGIENKKKELASKIMQIMKRTSNLEAIMVDVDKLNEKAIGKMNNALGNISHQINGLLDIEDGWASFHNYFMEMHPSFLQYLDPDGVLSDNEIRHCCYLKLGLSNHEITNMLFVSPKSVEAIHYRIKKKLNLTKDKSLRQIIRSEST